MGCRVALLLFMAGLPLFASQAPAGLPANPNDLLRQVIGREVRSIEGDGYFMWLDRYSSRHGLVTKRFLTTPRGILGRIVAFADNPLTAEQRQMEDKRLDALKDPIQMRDKNRKQQEERDRWNNLMRVLPDAFLCHYSGTETGSNGHQMVVLNFEPNPKWSARSMEQRPLEGMKGRIKIDIPALRVVSIDAHAFKEVSLGWGLLGRVLPGGVLHLDQAEVLPGHWDSTYLKVHIDVRILFIKTITLDEEGIQWDYHPVSAMKVTEALDKMRKMDGNSAPLPLRMRRP
jgi:hypothetical protein